MTNLIKNSELFESLSQREFEPRETLLVLKHNINVFWSWGVERIVNFYNKGLILVVNGNHHCGIVFIILAWNDTYSYYLLNDDGSIKVERHEVYFDFLQSSIDKDVEYINDYN
ncbi:hypothetical protein LZZ90_08380 [Flavobacterium sp. SM15]|uniref:hypothetical protein n=1 Tax=Flavobacterium sp. SM15 TaxID=2908005 RepID=UPI001EDA6991|nr:hypothetical protein [Flavobacterium sp. SM15]MCG2611523.1 hypothetical protein [Flavobacterium sp. SM15]